MSKPIQIYHSEKITVSFDPNRCVHSGVCLRSLPQAFDITRKRWIRPELAAPEEVAETVSRCPSGALEVVAEKPAAGEIEPQGGRAVIRLSSDGPLLVEGIFQIETEAGETIPGEGKAALCRCGATGTQPFCDGSHKRVGFRSRR